MYRRDRLKIDASKTHNPADWSNFKKLRNEVNNAIKHAKSWSYYYWQNFLERVMEIPGKTWQIAEGFLWMLFCPYAVLQRFATLDWWNVWDHLDFKTQHCVGVASDSPQPCLKKKTPLNSVERR